jgi:HEAT repeat protein
MPEEKKHNVIPPVLSAGLPQACLKALAATGKALKALSFYPEKHPLREQLINSAYQAIVNLTSETPLSLVVQRNGFAFADKEIAFENSAVTAVFANELFIRQLQRLLFLPGVSRNEFIEFLSLLCLPPQKACEEGGIAGRLSRSGIASIIVDEIDISAVFNKRNVGESGDDATGAESAAGDEAAPGESKTAGGEQKELTVEELLAAMSAETDDARYLQLARLLLVKGRTLQQEHEFERLGKVIMAMAAQSADLTRTAPCRDAARSVLQQLSLGEMTAHLLDLLEDENSQQEQILYLVLTEIGADAVDPVIRRLLAARSQFARKTLMTALVRIGSPALPALLKLLTHGNWQVVNTAVAILGEIGNRDAVKDLALTASHGDSRVRMESIRSLARIGGGEATAVLLGLLKDPNQAIAIQSITWLGNSRNQGAIKHLLNLVKKMDLLGKQQPLKKEALLAIGRIGDRRILETLFSIVRKRYWIMPGRWEELKIYAVEAIGNLGGESARAFLEDMPADGGRLGRACHAALESMAQRNP